MSGLQRLKRYILDGIFILLPIALIVFLFGEILEVLEVVAEVLAGFVPRTTIAGIDVSHWIALLLLVTVAALLGFFSLTKFGNRIGKFIQVKVLNKIPAYTIMRDLSRQFAGFRENKRFSAAVVEMPMQAQMLAFIVEELNNGDYVVFIPTAPTPMVGQIQLIPRGRVTPLQVPMTGAINSISSWGVGSGQLFEAARLKGA